jgi:hypothetical protein
MKTVTNRAIALAGTAAAMTAMAVLATLPADASSAAKKTWTLKAGKAKTGTSVSFTGTARGTSKHPAIHFTDKNSGQTLTCQSGSSTGTSKVGKGQSGNGIAKVPGKSLKFTNCTGPGGISLTVKGTGTWPLNASSYSKAKGGVVTGSLTRVVSHVQDSSDPAVCEFTASGSVPSQFDNRGAKLVMPGKVADLKVSKVKGCLGLIKNGDKSSFKATFVVKASPAADNPIKITSP